MFAHTKSAAGPPMRYVSRCSELLAADYVRAMAPDRLSHVCVEDAHAYRSSLFAHARAWRR